MSWTVCGGIIYLPVPPPPPPTPATNMHSKKWAMKNNLGYGNRVAPTTHHVCIIRGLSFPLQKLKILLHGYQFSALVFSVRPVDTPPPCNPLTAIYRFLSVLGPSCTVSLTFTLRIKLYPFFIYFWLVYRKFLLLIFLFYCFKPCIKIILNLILLSWPILALIWKCPINLVTIFCLRHRHWFHWSAPWTSVWPACWPASIFMKNLP